jgi:hypothetical protein
VTRSTSAPWRWPSRIWSRPSLPRTLAAWLIRLPPPSPSLPQAPGPPDTIREHADRLLRRTTRNNLAILTGFL